jgi:hypothetical protein
MSFPHGLTLADGNRQYVLIPADDETIDAHGWP